MSDYLKKEWGKSRWQRAVKFRLGNKMREERYWVAEEERACRWRKKKKWEYV